ncbi:Protein kinase domain-containing protein isoform 2 [Cladophialophora immunda]|nr:Protein kinase domain-containing protein isoform 2 [Cladophialophora immunda]
MPVTDDKAELRDELDHRWILNLSMHFRDKSDREKFFVTYAQTPNFWRRVTISCDYRNAEPGSLEMDLKELQFQRDKSMQIYESIRDSLPEIQFYDTVTNLKLETTDGRLHVHVTEDVNEIIPYPPKTTLSHILNDEAFRPMRVRESELTFDSHLSGFVYKVLHKGTVYIKKEIPGPDTVDEFLYEINALHALHDSDHVIKLEAIVLDDTESVVKGLLIGYAERGAIVDLLYDHRGAIAWEDRCRWAEQAVRGLSEIHQEGYVQGDFTLSNIVVDGDGNAKIIDINRRGCPVGWEPPEIATKIASNQRISMYIGEKSDIYQLGMTLWALAMDDDEPERHVPPLSVEEFPSDVPNWYQDIVRICLSSRPRDRLSAKELVGLFPSRISSSSEQIPPHQRPALKLRTMKKYIDPADAVERDDILRLRSNVQQHEDPPYSPESSRDDYTFTYPKSSNYEFESETSGYDRPRGRRPPTNYAHLGKNERHHWESEEEGPTPTEDLEPNIVAISPGMDREFDELELDGHPYLISRRTFNDEELKILEGLPQAESSFPDQEHLPENGATESTNFADIFHPLPARRPSLLAATSATSESTPRNSQDILATLAQYRPENSECLENSTEQLNDGSMDLKNNAENVKNPTEEDLKTVPQKSSDVSQSPGDGFGRPENYPQYPGEHLEIVPQDLENPTHIMEDSVETIERSMEKPEESTDHLTNSTVHLESSTEDPENAGVPMDNIQRAPEQVENHPETPNITTTNTQQMLELVDKDPQKPETPTETLQAATEEVEQTPENPERNVQKLEKETDHICRSSDYGTSINDHNLFVRDHRDSVASICGNIIPHKTMDQPSSTATSKPPSLPFMDSGYGEALADIGDDRDFPLIPSAAQDNQLPSRSDKTSKPENRSLPADDHRLAEGTLRPGEQHEGARLFARTGNDAIGSKEPGLFAPLTDTAEKGLISPSSPGKEPSVNPKPDDTSQPGLPGE